MDETGLKIMKAAMDLLTEQGYDATTTKHIARRAGVNEVTLFRKFGTKLNIVLAALQHAPWRPHITPAMFLPYTNNPQEDLTRFASGYLANVTPYFVRLSIGLRAPALYPHTAAKIMAVPGAFKQGLLAYFKAMQSQGVLTLQNPEAAATMFLSVCFGFVFFKASFGNALTPLQTEEYIANSVALFLNGAAAPPT